jgi:hypothetical protein
MHRVLFCFLFSCQELQKSLFGFSHTKRSSQKVLITHLVSHIQSAARDGYVLMRDKSGPVGFESGSRWIPTEVPGTK